MSCHLCAWIIVTNRAGDHHPPLHSHFTHQALTLQPQRNRAQWGREHGPHSHSRNGCRRQEKACLYPPLKTQGSDEGNHSSTSDCTKKVEQEKSELSLSCIPCPAFQDKTMSFTSLLHLSSTSDLSRGFANPQNTLHQTGETQRDLESRKVRYKNQLLRGLVCHS